MKTNKLAKPFIDDELLIKFNASLTVCTIIFNSEMIKIDSLKKVTLDIDGKRTILKPKQSKL